MWPGSHSFYPVEPKRGHLKRGLGGTIIGDIIIKRIVASVAVAKKKTIEFQMSIVIAILV